MPRALRTHTVHEPLHRGEIDAVIKFHAAHVDRKRVDVLLVRAAEIDVRVASPLLRTPGIFLMQHRLLVHRAERTESAQRLATRLAVPFKQRTGCARAHRMKTAALLLYGGLVER